MKKTIKRFFRRLIIKLLKKILPIPQEFIYILAFSFAVTTILIVSLYALANTTTMKFYKSVDTVATSTQVVVEPQKVAEVVKYNCSPSTNDEVNRLLNKYFKTCDEIYTMWGIAQAESKGQIHAIGYNCFYKGDKVYTTRVAGAISTSCKAGHQQYAWSEDIGYFQIHSNGSKYTKEQLLDLETNFKEAQRIKKQQGFTAWYTFKNNLHLAYIK